MDCRFCNVAPAVTRQQTPWGTADLCRECAQQFASYSRKSRAARCRAEKETGGRGVAARLIQLPLFPEEVSHACPQFTT